ncbi:MAG: hypothetical protein OEW75_18530, partial [Cyclobacteriaceae bacterium]|nr:hypothetical protein [Cyclobacteriaceae bacterium]
DGRFLNYVNKDRKFLKGENLTNLEDSNGRAIWALGFIIYNEGILPDNLINIAKRIIDKIPEIENLNSPRAISFAIKGLYFYDQSNGENSKNSIDILANKLLDKFNAVSDVNWKWYEDYLTYANSILPEAMLYAYLATKNPVYKRNALITFKFLLSKIFVGDKIKVISNKTWFHNGTIPNEYGEQPIDVANTIQTLDLFYEVFSNDSYKNKMEIAFSWFLGNNHLNQIIYNPITGGCYDGLEEYNVNLNQGAESTICYLISRLIMEKVEKRKEKKRYKLIMSHNNRFSGVEEIEKVNR